MAKERYQRVFPKSVGENIRLNVTGEFHESDVNRFFRYHFEVPYGTKEIRFSFIHTPEYLEDPEKTKQLMKVAYLKYTQGFNHDKDFNIDELISLCFDAEYPLRNILRLYIYKSDGKYVGEWSPRYNDSKSYAWINEYGSSKGLMACEIAAGTWIFEIGVGSVLTEKCRFELEITLRKEASQKLADGTDASREHDGGQIAANRTAKASKKGWFAGQLHVHSNYSDGKNSVHEIAQKFQIDGLDFFALTDHNTTRGWESDAGNNRILILKGIEIGSAYGHAIGLGIKRHINWRTEDGEIRNITEIAQEIHKQKGLFSVAHPFTIGYPVCTGCRWEYKELDFKLIDLLEVWFYPWKLRKIETYRGFEWWNDLLNQGLRVTGISSIDCHNVNSPLEFGPVPKTIVFSESFDENQIINGLKKGHAFSTCGPMIYFTAEYDNKKYICGDDIKNASSQPLSFTVEIIDLNCLCRLKVIKNGNVLLTQTLSPWNQRPAIFTDNFDFYESNRGQQNWYRCEIYKAEGDEDLIGFTNPIYSTHVKEEVD